MLSNLSPTYLFSIHIPFNPMLIHIHDNSYLNFIPYLITSASTIPALPNCSCFSEICNQIHVLMGIYVISSALIYYAE